MTDSDSNSTNTPTNDIGSITGSAAGDMYYIPKNGSVLIALKWQKSILKIYIIFAKLFRIRLNKNKEKQIKER
jgi:hypothetical protein